MISLSFFGILLATLVPYWLIQNQTARNLLLLSASFTFIYLMDPNSLLVTVALSFFCYMSGRAISRLKNKTLIHLLSICCLLVVLVLFKYLGLLNGVLNHISMFMRGLPAFNITNILLPLGISYIIFKHISYLTDIKWGLVKPGSFIQVLLYSSLFTIFVAGPIERFERFNPQVNTKLIWDWQHVDYGFMRIVFGMFKKLVIADWLGYLTNPLWQNPQNYPSYFGMLAIVGYSFQIYFDFAGYSDIAIGSSRLFGVRIMENFNSPYLAPNISQFWRRWHVSLSDWIRDYLFFPLSGVSQSKFWLVICVPIIAMALCGIWHGAAWHYMFWGIWHGVGLAMFQIWSERKRKHKSLAKVVKQKWFGYTSILLNFSFVATGWWWFR